jgi:hypothetical protein
MKKEVLSHSPKRANIDVSGVPPNVTLSAVPGEGFQTPKFQNFDKAKPNSQFHGKYIDNNVIRIRVSLIHKLSGTPT